MYAVQNCIIIVIDSIKWTNPLILYYINKLTARRPKFRFRWISLKSHDISFYWSLLFSYFQVIKHFWKIVQPLSNYKLKIFFDYFIILEWDPILEFLELDIYLRHFKNTFLVAIVIIYKKKCYVIYFSRLNLMKFILLI